MTRPWGLSLAWGRDTCCLCPLGKPGPWLPVAPAGAAVASPAEVPAPRGSCRPPSQPACATGKGEAQTPFPRPLLRPNTVL